MKVTIFGKTFSNSFEPYIKELFSKLEKHKVEIYVFEPFLNFMKTDINFNPKVAGCYKNHDSCPDNVDFMISIGGDGTFLECIAYLSNFNIPVVGINSGRLGFLANISRDEISSAFDAIFLNKFELEFRSMIEIHTETKLFDGLNFALNEATIQKKDSTMIKVDTYLNDEYLNTYWTDGLIISTPTGSTAYSLSVGGPLIEPESNNFIIAPIASHNLSVRPIVVPDNKIVTLEVSSRSKNYLITVDNRTEVVNSEIGKIILKKADFKLKMLRLPFNTFYTTIRNKLLWGLDKRN